jgi:hypothetical protein
LFLWKVQYPIGIDELVPKIYTHLAQHRLQLIAGHNAVGPHQQKKIRPWVSLAAQACQPLTLSLEPALDLCSRVLRRNKGRRVAVGVKDKADPSTLHIQRHAVLAVLALVRHYRVGVQVTLPGGLQVAKGLLELLQFRGHTSQRLALCIGLRHFTCHCHALACQGLLLALERRPLGPNSLSDIENLLFALPQSGRCLRHFNCQLALPQPQRLLLA